MVVTKAGALRNGAERGHGTIWHLAPGTESWNAGRALCGAAPALQWTTWGAPAVTCAKCRQLAEQLEDEPCHGPQDTTCPACGLGRVD